jgi:hypothetical protein
MRWVLRAVIAGAAASMAGCGGGGENSSVGGGGAGAAGNAPQVKKADQAPDLYSTRSGNYRVAFPAAPQITDRTQPTPAGLQALHSAILQDKNKVVRSVTWSTFPQHILKQQGTDAVLNNGIRGMVSSTGWTMLGKEPIEIGPHPAFEVRFQVRAQNGDPAGRGMARVAIIGDRLYQVIMVGPEATTKTEDLEKFVRSFALIEDVPVIASREPARPAPTTTSNRPAPMPSTPAQQKPDRATVPLVKSAAGATVARFEFVSADEDHVGTNGPNAGKPNKQNDLHFRAELDLPPGTVVDELIVSSGGFHRWVTRPSDRYWLLGVEQNGKPLIPGYVETVGTVSGKQTFDLFVQADLGPGTPFELRAALTIDGKPVDIGASCTRPRPVPKPGAAAKGSSSGGAQLVSAQWIGDADDKVGGFGGDSGKPNGEMDQHLRIELELPGETTIDNVVVAIPNSGSHWESKPSDRYWPVGVYRGNEVVSAGHIDRVGTFSGKQILDLYVNGGARSGSKFDVALTLSIKGKSHTVKATCERP